MALRNIRLRDFVIVQEMSLDLDDGFTVFTGETGAGKSILIDALQLALGARAEALMVREGASRAEVCAEFDCPIACRDWLKESGFDSSDTLLIRRTIDLQGRSRAWINGSAATATQLREIGNFLLTIHGQHAWQSLNQPEAVRALLDAYAGIDTVKITSLWQEWRRAQKALADARAAQSTLHRELERLNWQINELEKLAPEHDEWEELNTSHSRLSSTQALMDAAQTALDTLEGEASGALYSLARAGSMLRGQAHIEPEFREIGSILDSCIAQVEDAAHSLNAYLRRINPNPEVLAALDQRMTLWVSLSRRYHSTPANLPALFNHWKEEVSRLDAAANLTPLETLEKAASQAYMDEARGLSKLRKLAAPQLARAVSAVMQELGMQGGRFEVNLQKTTLPAQGGLEDVGFLVAAHAGSTPRPIGKVASGGELSRIALAIAVTTSRIGTAQALIFDEVDSGVGGAVAEAVGRLMKQLGKDRQVLAVTHLPQVASYGDHHLLVSKQSEGGTTVSAATPVQGEQRVAEVARMLGGERLSITTLAHAREMLGTDIQLESRTP